MLKKIKNNVLLASLAIPAFAEDISLKADDTGLAGAQKLTISGFISSGINLIIIVVSLVFVFMLILGGFSWVTSGGDEKKVAAARAKVTSALVGLVIVIASWAIIKLLGILFGVNITDNLTIPSFFQ